MSLVIEKCRYYNDAQTASSLMIDDFVPISVTINGIADPSNDWGYLKRSEESLFKYFEDHFLERFPDVKGTFFIPTESHLNVVDNGYKVLRGDFGKGYGDFFSSIANKFEVAFHGIRHTYIDSANRNRLLYEFNHLNLSDIPALRSKLEDFESTLGIKISGGKFPGYRSNQFGHQIANELGFLWWTSTKAFLSKRMDACKHTYWEDYKHIIDLPLTFLGSAFNNSLWTHKTRKNRIKSIREKWTQYRAEVYLQKLYENQKIITIQEHFQNQRTDGKRQGVNVYDDIHSLVRIYSILRGADIWYAKMSDIANYLESYDHTTIETSGYNEITVTYKGSWEKMMLSFKSNQPLIQKKKNGEKINGIYKNGNWVYNGLSDGIYVLPEKTTGDA